MNTILIKQLSEVGERVGEQLRAGSMTITAAESCTGGLLLSTLTDIAGSSAYVLGGVVTYSNELKQRLINVSHQTLLAHGAVSEQTAYEMAVGVAGLIGADFNISITGIAGPGGGTPDKPVGLVYIGLHYADETQVRRYQWEGDRYGNKVHSVIAALEWVEEVITQRA